MAVSVEVICSQSFSFKVPGLYFLVNKSQFDIFFPESKESPCTLLFSHSKQKSGILVCACLLPDSHIPAPDSVSALHSTKPLRIFASELFFKHARVRHESKGVVRLFRPFGLSKVVLGCTSALSFKYATSETFSNRLRTLATHTNSSVLARQGERLSLEAHGLASDDTGQDLSHLSELILLECYPVTQGVITASTALVVVDCGSYQTSKEQLHQNNLGIGAFLTASDFAHYGDSLCRGESMLDTMPLAGTGFCGQVQALECWVDVKIVDLDNLQQEVSDGHGPELDLNRAIFVSKQLLLKLGLFNGEFVVMSTLLPKKLQKSLSTVDVDNSDNLVTSRACELVVAVRVADFNENIITASDCVGIISNVQWFNLTQGDPLPFEKKTLKIKRWNPLSTVHAHTLSESSSRTANPPFAEEIFIEQVRSLEITSHSLSDLVFRKYFSVPRLVSKGIIVSVPTSGNPDVMETYSEQITRWPNLCFIVKDVKGGPADFGPFLADTKHTRLYLDSTVNSLSPQAFWPIEPPSLWRNISPAGLSRATEQLVAIMQPYTKPRSTVLRGKGTILLQGPSGCGKYTAVKAACQMLHLNLLKYNCVSLSADTAAACESKMMFAFHKAEHFKPCVILLRNLQLLGRFNDHTEMDTRVLFMLRQLMEQTLSGVVVIASISNGEDLCPDVLAAFIHQVFIERPTEEERRAMLCELSQKLPVGNNVNINKLAQQTVGYVLGDLSALTILAGQMANKRIRKACSHVSLQHEEDLCVSGLVIQPEDFNNALDILQERQSRTLGAPKIPSVRWQDIGGLHQVKKDILDTIQLPLDHPELAEMGLKRSGLLLYGPPGTGKTLLAKAVATECSLTFLSVKGPELLHMYVGQSEENIREVFSSARAAAPCIIFFDELDSLAPNRGRSGDSGGVMDRVVSQLLAELDGLHACGDVFVIGATNRPDLLDPSLLRPGRFDKLIYVGINEDKESQLQVLKAVTNKFHLAPGISLEDIVAHCPPQMTGADIYALCSDAMLAAVRRKISRIYEGLDEESSDILLSTDDFQQALSNIQPSVPTQELMKYKRIHHNITSK